jgi:hypothetical protein
MEKRILGRKISSSLFLPDLLRNASQVSAKFDELIRKILGALSTLTQCIAELRNLYGTGHGKDVKTVIVKPKYAALVVNAATTLALFLYQSHEDSLTSGTSHS